MVGEAWENFFVAQVGASAALLGLLFVGISLNLGRILSSPVLPQRALFGLMLLLAVLGISLVTLVPSWGMAVLGGAVLVVAALLIVLGARIHLALLAERRAAALSFAFALNVGLFVASVLPLAVAGALLVSGAAQGLGWLAAGMILATVKAVVDAWVLLVEINR